MREIGRPKNAIVEENREVWLKEKWKKVHTHQESGRPSRLFFSFLPSDFFLRI